MPATNHSACSGSWGADVLTRRLIAVAAAVLTMAGCSLDKQAAPPLTGPSELGLSLAVTATPDVITQDGHSQAVLEVMARDASSQPVSGLTLRAETYVGSTPVDFGQLSAKTVSTGSDGRAVLTYRAPAASASQESDVLVTVAVTPVGTNYASALPRSVQIRLARPGVVLPPNGTPVASFYFSPTNPRVDDDVFFDGSGSFDSDGHIVSYEWSFGDGRTAVSASPTTRHHYDLAGTYNVTLTVTDDRGLKATSETKTLTVGAGADPTATFTVSPAAPKINGLVSFNASGSKATTGHTIVQYVWDFGDGTPIVSSGDPLMTHTYGAQATYTVVLRVTDDVGRFAVSSQSVSVTP